MLRRQLALAACLLDQCVQQQCLLDQCVQQQSLFMPLQPGEHTCSP